MNDELIMNNYLLVLKSTCEVYVHGTLESSNENVHNILKNGLDSTMLMQHNTYNLMVENGWYKVTNVDKNVVTKTLDKIKQV